MSERDDDPLRSEDADLDLVGVHLPEERQQVAALAADVEQAGRWTG
jgi:hypothetical protein